MLSWGQFSTSLAQGSTLLNENNKPYSQGYGQNQMSAKLLCACEWMLNPQPFSIVICQSYCYRQSGCRNARVWLPRIWKKYTHTHTHIYINPGGTVVKNLPANAWDVGLITGLGRSAGEENGNPTQCSYLGYPMNKEAWWAIIHALRKNWTPLNTPTHVYV